MRQRRRGEPTVSEGRRGASAAGLALADLLILEEPLREVLTALVRGGEMSAGEVAAAAGLPVEATGETLETLARQGYVQTVGDEVEPKYRVRHARPRRLAERIWGRLDEFLVLLSRGSRIALLLQLGGAVLDYLVHLLLARWLGAAEFGAYTYQLGWSQLLVTFAWLGVTQSSPRFIP